MAGLAVTDMGDLVETADGWRVPVSGWRVVQLCMDFAVTLRFGEAERWLQVRIAEEFELGAALVE